MNYKIIVAALSSFIIVITALYAMDKQKELVGQPKADVIVIDSMKSFGELERPGVAFFHDKHTKALEKQGKDCKSCHQVKDGKMIYMFNRTEEVDRQTTLDIYHDNCIGCHEDVNETGNASVPVECGSCHQWETPKFAAKPVVSFDKSLHYRHIDAADGTCETCHHSYDEASKKVTYVKGKEAACKTCHKDELLKDAVSYRKAAHTSCVGCHQEVVQKGGKAAEALGSANCETCHDPEKFNQIAELQSVPRLKMDQPDLTFVKSFAELSANMMDAVVFNHKAHEQSVESCTTCHHATVDSCEKCHTLEGTELGNGITLAQAMHDTGSEKSCIGCHEQVQQQADCAGCHTLINKEKHISDDQSCKACHTVPIENIAKAKKAGNLSANRFKATQSSKSSQNINFSSLPEMVIIDGIADQYQGARFPHRAIVESMMASIQNSSLAEAFHKGDASICVGCHHNSQDNLTPPPSCISCHSSKNVSEDDLVPPAKAAYHRQCFDCHEVMEIEKPASADCVACHREK